jgi:hypothetical protein
VHRHRNFVRNLVIVIRDAGSVPGGQALPRLPRKQTYPRYAKIDANDPNLTLQEAGYSDG